MSNPKVTKILKKIFWTVISKKILEILLEDADLIILNTCAVREYAEERVFGEIGNLKRLKANNPDLLFAICGCMVQEETMVEHIKLNKNTDILFISSNDGATPTSFQGYNLKEVKQIRNYLIGWT